MRLSDYEVGQLTDEEIEKRYNIPGYFYSFDKAKLLEKKYTEFRDSAKNMLDLYTDKENKIDNAKANVVSDLLDKAEELEFLTRLAKQTSAPIYNDINDNGGFNTMATSATKNQFGISGKEYKQEFFNQFKSGFRNASGHLQESILVQGGYTVPTEMHSEIVRRLTNENVLRQISNVIETANDRNIVISGSAPSVNWIGEGAEISLSNLTFDKKTLGAHKLGVAIAVTNELIADSFYSLSEHVYNEFSDAISREEEDAFLNAAATDTSKPTGLLNQLDSDTAVTTAGASIAADDIINVETKLDTPYRKNACWLMNPATLGTIRKLKDNNQQYIWQQNFADSTPLTLLGYPVYLSPYVPTIAAGNTVILFGDFSRFIIGQRGDMVFKPLFETRALTDETVYLLLERVDCVLSDTKAIVSLKIKSA